MRRGPELPRDKNGDWAAQPHFSDGVYGPPTQQGHEPAHRHLREADPACRVRSY